MPCLVRSMDTLEVREPESISRQFSSVALAWQSFREYEDAMGNIDHLWSLSMGSQIRIVKMSVDAHGRAEISNKWVSYLSPTGLLTPLID